LIILFRKLLANDVRVFGNYRKRYIPFILVGAALTIVLSGVGDTISANIGAGLLPNQQANAEMAASYPVLAFFQMAICAPVIEELIFRRAIKVIAPNRLVYYIASVLLFGFFHIIWGFTFPASFLLMFGSAGAALALAYIYDRSNNIWCSILAHLINNVLAVIVMLSF